MATNWPEPEIPRSWQLRLGRAEARASDFQSSGRGFDSRPGRNQVTQVNSAFHPSGVVKSSSLPYVRYRKIAYERSRLWVGTPEHQSKRTQAPVDGADTGYSVAGTGSVSQQTVSYFPRKHRRVVMLVFRDLIDHAARCNLRLWAAYHSRLDWTSLVKPVSSYQHNRYQYIWQQPSIIYYRLLRPSKIKFYNYFDFWCIWHIISLFILTSVFARNFYNRAPRGGRTTSIGKFRINISL